MLSRDVTFASQILIRVSSALSILGCLFVIASYLYDKTYRTPANRLVFSTAIYCLIGNLGTIIGESGIGVKGLCELQGFFIQFLLGGVLYTGFMALNLLIKFKRKYTLQQVEKFEKFYHFAVFVGTVLPSSILLFYPSDVYGVGLRPSILP
ncbi:hypothetical protein ROZALSC1DRAFT_29315 [Rozella allomycis CSF55]|uniref:Uncharacterized protein n=1 Tax=Rozella allomycis (strain CSF55) TaxID=988480 RepID=A0A075B2K1_ROZAC|nr:hypothetical protein O9G_003219 [Rozella allomycis CSF55]RKP19044.1 hypothetical protein ROZALSC1DRAFT_29315 [Rozella allomycis CSF55]|eukprot:EPZ35033.1 hypothetical protein O9G_003219 [Rozella allomycis CSF55]